MTFAAAMDSVANLPALIAAADARHDLRSVVTLAKDAQHAAECALDDIDDGLTDLVVDGPVYGTLYKLSQDFFYQAGAAQDEINGDF